MSGPSLRTLNAERLPIAVWDYGGEGPPVLFLHGFLDTGRSFEDVALAARDFVRPLCMDWRGHGASGRASADAAYHQLDHLKDLVGVLHELRSSGEDVAAVVGHSMGGTVSLMLAAFRPAWIPRLLLLDCLGGYAGDADMQIDQLGGLVDHLVAPLRPFRAFPDRAGAEARIRANNPGLSAAGAERIARHYLEKQADGALLPRLDSRLRGPNPYRFPEGHWQRICSRATMPVHVLVPDGGYCHRLPALQERFRSLPDGHWAEIAGVGHHVHVEAVDRVCDSLRALLKRRG